jgi:hypothetical protein
MPIVILKKRPFFHPGTPQIGSTKHKRKYPFKGPSEPMIHVGGFAPLKRFPLELQLHMAFCQPSYKERQLSLVAYSNEIQRMKQIRSFKLDVSPMEKDYQNRIHWYNKDESLRYCFKRVLHAWLRKRYTMRYLNTDDPGTLSPPIKGIELFDTRTRGTYVFEASTLKRAMETDLGYSNWLFPEPNHPKNPLTNLIFTEGQRVKALYELRKLNKTSWILEAYQDCCWNIDDFRQQYYIKLKLRGLEDIIRNPSGEELQELLEEFIEEHYNYHEINYISHLSILRWAVKYSITDVYMVEWIQCFRKYYTLEILYGKPQVLNNPDLLDPIYNSTLLLLENTSEIARLGKKRLLSVPRIVYTLLEQS